MPKPQVENGFVRIANELYDEALGTKLPGQALYVFLAIIRKTYGYNKKQDIISMGQLSEMTDIPRQRVNEAIHLLEARRMIVVIRSQGGRGHANTYAVQKDYALWTNVTPERDVEEINVTPERDRNVTVQRDRNVTLERAHKRQTDNKDNASAKNADARAPLSRTNNLPPSNVQVRVLFPAGAGNHTDAIREIERHGWHIRGADLLRVTAAFVDASGLPIPNAAASRNGWLKDIRQHLEDFGVGALEQAYPATVHKMQAEGLTISRPGSLTKTLPAVVATLRTKALSRSFTTESIYDEPLTEPANEPQRKP